MCEGEYIIISRFYQALFEKAMKPRRLPAKVDLPSFSRTCDKGETSAFFPLPRVAFRKPPFVVAPTTLSVDLRFFDADRVALTPTSACGLNQELNRAAFGFSTTGGALFTSMRSWSTFDASNTIDMGGGTPERRDEPLCAVDIGGETPPKCKRVGAKSAPTLATEFLRPLAFLPPASAAVTFVLLLLFAAVSFFVLFLLPRVVVVVAPFTFVRAGTPIASFANETSLSPALCEATTDFSRNGNCLLDAVVTLAPLAALVLYIELRCENILPCVVFNAAVGDVCLNAEPREPIDGSVGKFFIVVAVGGFKLAAGVFPNRMEAA
jgi:hypothetical protein